MGITNPYGPVRPARPASGVITSDILERPPVEGVIDSRTFDFNDPASAVRLMRSLPGSTLSGRKIREWDESAPIPEGRRIREWGKEDVADLQTSGIGSIIYGPNWGQPIVDGQWRGAQARQDLALAHTET